MLGNAVLVFDMHHIALRGGQVAQEHRQFLVRLPGIELAKELQVGQSRANAQDVASCLPRQDGQTLFYRVAEQLLGARQRKEVFPGKRLGASPVRKAWPVFFIQVVIVLGQQLLQLSKVVDEPSRFDWTDCREASTRASAKGCRRPASSTTPALTVRLE